MPTIYDIAKFCNVSAATVSYVLNGRGNERRISGETQKKIQKAASVLGYSKGRIVRTDHPIIAVYWLQRHLEMTMPSLISGINDALSAEISPVDIVINPYEQGHLSSQENLWRAGSYDAAIIVAAGTDDLDYLVNHPTQIPTVLLNRELSGYSSVTIDHIEAGELAAQQAMIKGGSDLALVLNPSALYGLNYRGEAILRICREHGVDLQGNLFYCENQIDNGYELGWEMIRKNQLHKVIICIYDMVGLGIMSALNEAGIPIGEDVQVIATSSGLSRLFARSTPPMTVVDLKMEEVSQRSVKMAIDLADGRLAGPQNIIVHPTIIYRKSCPFEGTLLLDQ